MDHLVSKKPTSNAIIAIIMIFATALGINKSYEQFPGQKLKAIFKPKQPNLRCTMNGTKE